MKLSELNRIMRAHERTLNKLKKDSDGQLDLIRSQQWTIDHLNDLIAKLDFLSGQTTRLRNRLDEATTEIDNLKLDKVSINKDVYFAEASNNQLLEKIHQINKEAMTLKSKITDLEHEIMVANND